MARCLSLWVNASYRNETVLIVRGEKECTKNPLYMVLQRMADIQGPSLHSTDIGSAPRALRYLNDGSWW